MQLIKLCIQPQLTSVGKQLFKFMLQIDWWWMTNVLSVSVHLLLMCFCADAALNIFHFRFYTYGNFPLERHLELINEKVLSEFQKTSVDTAVPAEPRWSSPVGIDIGIGSELNLSTWLSPSDPWPVSPRQISAWYSLQTDIPLPGICQHGHLWSSMWFSLWSVLYFKSQLCMENHSHQKPVLILPNGLNKPGERAHDRN